MRSACLAPPWPRADFADSCGPRRRVLAVKDESRSSVNDGLQASALTKGEHRSSTGHGLQRSDPEILDAGKDQALRSGKFLDQLRLQHRSKKLDRPACAIFQSAPFRPVADD